MDFETCRVVRKGAMVNWALEVREAKKLIGCLSFGISQTHKRAEIAYWIGEEYWNKGYCSEAAVEAIRYAFNTLNLNKITSRHMSHNPASGKVMIKAGMKQEGILRQDFLKNGQYADMVVYGLLRDEYVG